MKRIIFAVLVLLLFAGCMTRPQLLDKVRTEKYNIYVYESYYHTTAYVYDNVTGKLVRIDKIR